MSNHSWAVGFLYLKRWSCHQISSPVHNTDTLPLPGRFHNIKLSWCHDQTFPTCRICRASLLCIAKSFLRLEAFSYPLHTPEGLSPAGFSMAWCGMSFTWSFSHTHHKDRDFSSVWPPGGDEGADLSEAFATDNILVSCKCGFTGEQSEWWMLGFLIVKAMIQPLPGVGHGEAWARNKSFLAFTAHSRALPVVCSKLYSG